MTKENGKVASRMNRYVDDTRLVFMKEPKGGASAAVKRTVAIRRRGRDGQTVKLGVLLWA